MHDGKYVLLESVTYKDLFIPKGFITNGADIPRLLWSFLPPNKSNYLPAVVLHDFLCDAADYYRADYYFDSCLKDLEVHPIVRFVMVKGVKLYHYIRYHKQYVNSIERAKDAGWNKNNK